MWTTDRQFWLLASVHLAEWHTFGMEWKEHIAWLSPIFATTVWEGKAVHGDKRESSRKEAPMTRPPLRPRAEAPTVFWPWLVALPLAVRLATGLHSAVHTPHSGWRRALRPRLPQGADVPWPRSRGASRLTALWLSALSQG